MRKRSIAGSVWTTAAGSAPSWQPFAAVPLPRATKAPACLPRHRLLARTGAGVFAIGERKGLAPRRAARGEDTFAAIASGPLDTAIDWITACSRSWMTPWPSSSEIRSPIATAKATIAATPCRVRKSAHPACPSRRNKPSSGQEQLTNIPIHTPLVVWRRLSWTIELVCAKRSQSADHNGVQQIPKRDRRRSTIGTRTVVSAVLPGNISVHTGRPLPSRTAATTICRRSGRWSFEYPCAPASPRRAVERQCRGVHEHQRQIAEDPATLRRLDMQLIEIE